MKRLVPIYEMKIPVNESSKYSDQDKKEAIRIINAAGIGDDAKLFASRIEQGMFNMVITMAYSMAEMRDKIKDTKRANALRNVAKMLTGRFVSDYGKK